MHLVPLASGAIALRSPRQVPAREPRGTSLPEMHATQSVRARSGSHFQQGCQADNQAQSPAVQRVPFAHGLSAQLRVPLALRCAGFLQAYGERAERGQRPVRTPPAGTRRVRAAIASASLRFLWCEQGILGGKLSFKLLPVTFQVVLVQVGMFSIILLSKVSVSHPVPIAQD